MGFQDRNYARDNWSPRRYGPNRAGRGFAGWEVWKKIIAINIAVFLLQIFFTRPATEDDIRRMPYYGYDPYGEFDEYGEPLEEVEIDGSDGEMQPDGHAEEDDRKQAANGDEDAVKRDHQTGSTDNQAKEDKGDQTESGGVGLEKKQDSTAESEDPKAKEATTDRGETKQEKADRLRSELQEQYREQMREYRQYQLEHMRVSTVQDWLELDTQKVKAGQIWRLITAGFCHDRMAIWHLLFNMLFLFWFGRRLERVFGSAEFTAFYFASLLVSSLAYIGLDLYTQKNIPAIGASGAVWGVVALYALMYPYEKIFIYFLFPVEIRWLVLLYFIFDLHPVLLALGGTDQPTGVAHAAHIGGAVFGFLYWNQGWRLTPIIDRLKTDIATAKPKPRQSDESPNILQMRSSDATATSNNETDRMDEILRKISRQGRASLTDEELKILEETSRKMRQQRREES